MIAAPPWSSLVDLLRSRARQQAGETLYTFLADGEREEVRLSYEALDAQARTIAQALVQRGLPGDRALLLYQPGLEFIAAFFGCLYAGRVAVPAFPPRNPRHVPRIQSIVEDADAALCLASSNLVARSKELLNAVPKLQALTWIASDGLDPALGEAWEPPEAGRDTLAYLQYTSGSTSEPKGVMVTHGNLLHNLSFLFDGRGHTAIGSWLPFFHDMGLIYGILQALYGGIPCVLLAPPAFLQRPVRWLQAMSRYRASTAIAPNFSYDLCVQKVTEEEKAALDLSAWTMALNAAEPVRWETLERFAAAFAVCGFRKEFLKPAYGLAEATLGAAICPNDQSFTVKNVDPEALGKHRIAEVSAGEPNAAKLIGCGKGPHDQAVAIVNPETLERCAPDEVGEIWLASPSVARGYWKRPQETLETFQARLAGTGEGPFLRTGDLGLFTGGELFITGRCKDLIIVRGVNHYPQDIEWTVQKTHAALLPDAGAAFSIDVAGEEHLVVVQEVNRHFKGNLDEVIEAVRGAIAEEHGLQVCAVALVSVLTVPKTSSGKIQRQLCRARFLAGSFDPLKQWQLTAEKPSDQAKGAPDLFVDALARTTSADAGGPAMLRHAPPGPLGGFNPPSERAIVQWLRQQVAENAQLRLEEIDAAKPFAHYGLDSMAIVSLSEGLAKWLGRELSATILWSYPTIQALAKHLAAGPPNPGASVANHELPAMVQPAQARPAMAGAAAACAGASDLVSDEEIAALLAREIEASKQRRRD